MSSQKKVNTWARKRTSQGSSSYQTRLSAWRVKEDLSDSKSISKHGQNNTVEDYEGADDQAEDALQIALRYFEKGKRLFSLCKACSFEKILDSFGKVFKGKHIFLLIHDFCLFNGHLLST